MVPIFGNGNNKKDLPREDDRFDRSSLDCWRDVEDPDESPQDFDTTMATLFNKTTSKGAGEVRAAEVPAVPGAEPLSDADSPENVVDLHMVEIMHMQT